MTQEQNQKLWDAMKDPKLVVLTSDNFNSNATYHVVSNEKGLKYALEHSNKRCFSIRLLLPYKDLHEFTKEQDAHSKYICFKDYPDGLKLPIEINNQGIYVKWFDGMQFVSYEDLAERCTWQDGHPCGNIGKEVEYIL